MKKTKLIYKHIGYFNAIEDIQTLIGKDDCNIYYLHTSKISEYMEKSYGEFNSIDGEEVDIDTLDNLSFSGNKKYCFSFLVNDVDYVNNNINDYSNSFIDVYEFVRIEPIIDYEELVSSIANTNYDTIFMGLSVTSEDVATITKVFKLSDYNNIVDWINDVYRELCFQFNREDIKFLKLDASCSDTLFSSKKVK